jgi:TatD DNase family protein
MTAHAHAWVDAHAHICSSEMPLDPRMVADEAYENGCRGLVEVATDLPSLEKALLLQRQFPWIAIAAAVTPHEAEHYDPAFLDQITRLAGSSSLQAIGETGLDYWHRSHTEKQQKQIAAVQMELAAQSQLPLVIHCRDAFDDFFALLDHHYARGGRWLPGMLHCFTGTASEAERLLAQGWMISISGVVTYKKSEDLRRIVAQIPAKQLLVETDAPWLAPQSCRGKVNRPSLILETYEQVALLQGLTIAELKQQVLQNLQTLFHFKGWSEASPGYKNP